ncbi:MAG TPA: TIGR03013 family XrtA/PEP-CTERM system glycosyltransferase [Steroidobacteraceae bacterium]|nr:TIGR03013 family XrtA/PEP-CTERM system glycosyltransferase [Steroidobacteraceae bacterium]
MTIRIFRHYWQLPLMVVAVVEFLIFFGASIAGIWYAGDLPLLTVLTTEKFVYRESLLYASIFAVSSTAVGLYHARQRASVTGLLTRIIFAVLAAMAVIGGLAAALPQIKMTLSQLAQTGFLACCASIAVRFVFEKLVADELFKRRVLVYGAGQRAASISQLRRRSDRRGFNVVGYVPTEADRPDESIAAVCASVNTELLAHCRENLVDEIVVAMDDRRRAFPMYQLLECRLDGVEVTELVTFLERETGKVRLDVLNPSWFIFSDGFRRGRVHSIFERVFDVGVSFALLLLAMPIMLLAVLAIKIEDGPKASIFYRQIRVGRYGKNFGVLKFRSMREDAEHAGKAIWATKNDSRVTRVGSFMRVTRIDELPQIINVLRGEMSFVGPRPERPEFVSQLSERIPYYRERHTLKPGITGWAQLCYPYGSSEQDAIEKLQYDLFYIKNHTLLFYLAILLQTVEVVLWRKGAR